MGSKCSHVCPYKREVEGVLTHTEKKAVWTNNLKLRLCNQQAKKYQANLTVIWCKRGHETDSPSEPEGGCMALAVSWF